jgi:putative transcriptional regulator
MKKTKVYKDMISAVIHETASDLHEVGIINKKTLREFDESCLTPIHGFTSEQIRNLREREHVSQAIFAYYLNISKESVSQWERGTKRPAGTSLKLLSLVESKGLSAIL